MNTITTDNHNETEETVEVASSSHGSVLDKINWLPGDRVRLYNEPTHEGPHADDLYAPPAPIAVIQEVIRHRNNPAWVTGFVVEYEDDGQTEEIAASQVATYVYPKGWTP